MNPCIYTTQFPMWLAAASDCDAAKLVCFRSAKRWATAAKLLNRYGPLPILFRQQDDSDPVLACRFVAELVEIYFPERFETDDRRLAWLDENLWLQRETIKKLPRTDRFPTWESQFKAQEIDFFMDGKTWYFVRGLHAMKPLPLPRLRKLKDGRGLADNFTRGYALCHYPADEILSVPALPAAV